MRENPRPAVPFERPGQFSNSETEFLKKDISFEFDDQDEDEEDWDGNWDGQWQDQWDQSVKENSDWSSDEEDWNQDHHYPDADYYGDWEDDD